MWECCIDQSQVTRHERDLALVKNQEQLVQLRDNLLEDAVRAIATIVEVRDPYKQNWSVA